MAELFYTYAKAQTLISTLIDEVFDDADPEQDFAYNTVYKVDAMSRGEFVTYDVVGLDKPTEREYLEDLAPTNYKEGNVQTVKPIAYGAMLAVPKELIRDLADAGPGDGMVAARIGTYADFMREMKKTCFWRADSECALKLINGTSTAAKYVGRDATALFSASHTTLGNPSETWSNYTANASLTETNLDNAITALNTQVDDRSMPMTPASSYTLVVSPNLETAAWKLLNTDKKVNSANNDASRVYSMKSKINLVSWQQLDIEYGSDYTGWYVLSDRHSLLAKWRDKPYFEKESDLKTNSLSYGVNMRFRAFHKSPRGAVGYMPA